MTSSRWSFLLLGTILATTASGPAFAEDTVPPAGLRAQQVVVGSTPDMLIDAEVLAAAAVDAARAGDAISEELLDRIRTGSIAQIAPGPRTGGLVEVRAPQGVGLSEPKTAPEPVKAQPAAAPAAAPVSAAPAAEATVPTEAKTGGVAAVEPTEAPRPASEPAVAAEPAAPAPTSGEVRPETAASAKPEEAMRPAEPAMPAVAPEAAAEKSAASDEPAKPVETAAAPTAPVEVSAAPAAPAEVPAAPAAPAEVPAAVVETTATTVAATPVDPTPSAPVDPAGSAPVFAAPVEPAPVVAAPVPAVAAPVVAAIEPTATGVSYSTASEPAKPAATIPEPAKPVAAVPESVAPSAAPAAPTAANAPAAVPAVVPSTDAAIAATLAAEQAAAVLKTALEDLQSRAGTVEERADRAALLAFYADRAFLPLFVDAQGTTDRARAARAVLMHADRDGLEPKDFVLPQVAAGVAPQVRAEAEIAHARAVVRYARHLQSGRFDPRRVHELVTPEPPKTEAREVLGRLAAAASVAEVLESYAPPHEGYRRLKAMLADLRSTGEDQPMVMVPTGPLLKPGQKDARVALLRERLGVGGIVSDAEMFDPALAEAVMAFQRDRGLSPTGKVGRETVSALNEEKTGTAARIADVISNMERWRWLPRELGELHVFVNTADFHLDVMKAGQSIHHAKVIVGKPSNPTPVFSEDMRHVVVNPYWNVPYSIVKKEMIGKAQATAGGALGRGGWEVEIGRQRVDPTTVDWSTVDASKVTIRQRPGDGNALGNIKFLFPNRHAVYLHDTSSRGLFAQKFRALSHGCVRVHEPFSFADAVLSEEPEVIDGAKLKKMIGGGEKTINLKRPVPVHITYFTAWVDDAGQLQNRPDIYGHDARVKRLLDL